MRRTTEENKPIFTCCTGGTYRRSGGAVDSNLDRSARSLVSYVHYYTIKFYFRKIYIHCYYILLFKSEEKHARVIQKIPVSKLLSRCFRYY